MRNLSILILASIPALALGADQSSAETSAGKVLIDYDRGNATTRETIELIVDTLDRGYGWSNAYLTQDRKLVPMYCQPDNLSLTSSQLIYILRRALKEDKRLVDYPLGMSLLTSLQRAYPCKR
jgi:hypothetical protein